MKATKKIVGAACALVAAVALSAGSTFAWFSANATVNATGMSVQAKTDASLVIDTDHVVGNAITANLGSTTTELKPVTYTTVKDDVKVEASTEGAKTSYYYLANPEDVDTQTGLAKPTKTLKYTEVTTSNATEYYKDYYVYLAAAGNAATKTITATVTFDSATYTQKAVTVAFTVLDEANTDVASSVVATAPTDSVGEYEESHVANLGSIDLPLNTSSKSIPILMRVYFDGEAKNGTTAYVNSENITLTALSISVEFSAS